MSSAPRNAEVGAAPRDTSIPQAKGSFTRAFEPGRFQNSERSALVAEKAGVVPTGY